MQYRVDERTGNELSVLGLGCMRFPRGITGIDQKKSELLIMRAIEKGVNYFDTAHMYPGSEETLGKALANNGVREQIYIATKLPIMSCKKSEDFDRLFDVQLERLKTKYIDYYLMHNINSFDQWRSLCDMGIESWIKDQQERGRIRQIGFSYHGPSEEFIKVLEAYEWDFCQIQYNYSDENYQAGVAGLRRAAELKMPVIVMEPLLGGKLANLPAKADAVFKAADPALTPAAWGLRWLLNQPEVTVILSGMSNEMQLEENLKTAEDSQVGMLSEKEMQAYDQVVEVFQESYKVPCTGCGYCMPCPQNVNIPGCFSAYNSSFAHGRISGFMLYTNGAAANRHENYLASKCISCGKCEKNCPQHITISASLKDVAKRMEPFYYNIVMKIMRGRK